MKSILPEINISTLLIQHILLLFTYLCLYILGELLQNSIPLDLTFLSNLTISAFQWAFRQFTFNVNIYELDLKLAHWQMFSIFLSCSFFPITLFFCLPIDQLNTFMIQFYVFFRLQLFVLLYQCLLLRVQLYYTTLKVYYYTTSFTV